MQNKGRADTGGRYSGRHSGIYNLTLHVPNASVTNRGALEQLTLPSTSGAKVPLGDVAKISLQMGENTITHEFGKREVTIRVDNRDRALSDYLAEA
ncbi:hypothetical protein [Paraburkholderia guartelaensis]|uniref:Uncharacterized protein n=1 Tax=Paraburkholderia guartelaensis TaxID=2546446 RepID=A0ABU9SNP4_9BURK